jgi:hypothetical protein
VAISPIAIATHGLLNSPLSVAAVRGKLTIGDDEQVTGPGSGMVLPSNRWLDQIRREDEEIVAIIMAITEILEQ